MKRLNALLDFCFPRFCVGCKIQWAYICAACKKLLTPHPDRCPFCHRVMPHGQTCYDCFPYHRHLQWIMVAFVYSTFIKKLILQLKFGHKYDVASFLAQRLALLIQTNPSFRQAFREWTLFVSFVPSHWRRKYFVKWYNQSEILSQHVAKELQLSVVQCIRKQKYTVSQTQCTRKQRLTNLIDAFIIQETKTLPDWATLIVVDDITTTGSTLDEIAITRKKQHPTISIRWVVVWRHGK